MTSVSGPFDTKKNRETDRVIHFVTHGSWIYNVSGKRNRSFRVQSLPGAANAWFCPVNLPFVLFATTSVPFINGILH